MISMIMVGIAIAGIVSGFGDKAVSLGEAAQNKLVVDDVVKVPGSMKQFIVFLAMVSLGCVLFNIIAGDDEGSFYSSAKNVWRAELEIAKQ